TRSPSLTGTFGSSAAEIVACYQAQNEPAGAECALQRSADLRFSDARVVAHRDFNYRISAESAFEDHFNRPAISGLFKGERTEHIGAGGAKRAQITDFQSIYKINQPSSEAIAKHLVPRQCASRISLVQSRTESDVGAAIDDRR